MIPSMVCSLFSFPQMMTQNTAKERLCLRVCGHANEPRLAEELPLIPTLFATLLPLLLLIFFFSLNIRCLSEHLSTGIKERKRKTEEREGKSNQTSAQRKPTEGIRKERTSLIEMSSIFNLTDSVSAAAAAVQFS